MHQYIIDTSYASKGLVELISKDTKEYTDLITKQLSALTKIDTFDLQFIQREMDPTANYWHGRLFETQAELDGLQRKMFFLEAQILDKRHSMSALSGALLQINKQGISSVHGRPDNCPAGRDVYGVELKWLIWAGRNQSQHYEEPKKINQETIDLFAQLNKNPSIAPLDNPASGVNLAYQVVTTLDWLHYEQYEQDMVNLIG